MLLVWVLLAPFAYYFSGVLGLEGLTLSGFLCLIPGWLAFWIISRYGDASNLLLTTILGSSFRMCFVLFGVLIVKLIGRYPEKTDFLIWVVLFFLATLAVETSLLLKHVKSTAAPTSKSDTLQSETAESENDS